MLLVFSGLLGTAKLVWTCLVLTQQPPSAVCVISLPNPPCCTTEFSVLRTIMHSGSSTTPCFDSICVVQAGKELDLPVYFGDAGSAAVLHSIGAHRASCCVVTLDSPGANYRTVWALHKSFPDVKVYVRAHDVTHGINLEKVGVAARPQS